MVAQRVMLEELPWICLFVCALALAQLQFKYCVPCIVASLKVIEAGTVVVMMRLWVNREQWMSEFGGEWTVEAVQQYVQDAAAALTNRTEL